MNLISKKFRSCNIKKKHSIIILMRKKLRIISTKYLFIPSISLFCIFFVLLGLLLFKIRIVGSRLIGASKDYIYYSDTAREFQFGSDELTRYARLFVSTGNQEYLDNYFYEDRVSRHRDHALEMLSNNQEYEFSYAQLLEAHTLSLNLMNTEFHAMALRIACSDVNISLDAYPEIAACQFTPEEKSMNDEQLKSKACAIMISEDYFNAKSAIYSAVNNSIYDILARSQWQFQKLSNRVRIIVKITIGCIAIMGILMFFVFIALGKFLIRPLTQCTNQVGKGEQIQLDRGFAEIKYLEQEYNTLMEHKELLENTLRRLSQTDALTGIPNRLGFEKYINSISTSIKDTSFTIISFDINGLKKTNDTYGHIEGDKLIRHAAECIKNTFANENQDNCFRTGGDEFIACLTGKEENEIKQLISSFIETQSQYDVVIAAGYAWSPTLKNLSTKELFNKADKMMYEVKQKMKAES